MPPKHCPCSPQEVRTPQARPRLPVTRRARTSRRTQRRERRASRGKQPRRGVESCCAVVRCDGPECPSVAAYTTTIATGSLQSPSPFLVTGRKRKVAIDPGASPVTVVFACIVTGKSTHVRPPSALHCHSYEGAVRRRPRHEIDRPRDPPVLRREGARGAGRRFAHGHPGALDEGRRRGVAMEPGGDCQLPQWKPPSTRGSCAGTSRTRSHGGLISGRTRRSVHETPLLTSCRPRVVS